MHFVFGDENNTGRNLNLIFMNFLRDFFFQTPSINDWYAFPGIQKSKVFQGI
jgi:hypothetical protein